MGQKAPALDRVEDKMSKKHRCGKAFKFQYFILKWVNVMESLSLIIR